MAVDGSHSSLFNVARSLQRKLKFTSFGLANLCFCVLVIAVIRGQTDLVQE
mgnify:CR=1